MGRDDQDKKPRPCCGDDVVGATQLIRISFPSPPGFEVGVGLMRV